MQINRCYVFIPNPNSEKYLIFDNLEQIQPEIR